MTLSQNQEGRPARRVEIDALRAGAIFLVFLIHVAQIFSPLESWHIDSPDKSWILGQFTIFLGPWIMPLFMFLAGAAAWFTRQHHDDAFYLRHRAGRLLIPLGAGTLLLIPPQIYLRRLSRAEFEGSYWEFYPTFFQGVVPSGNFSYGHLWFLAYLFLYMVAALPLFRLLDRETGGRALTRLAAWMERPGGLWIPGLLIAITQLLLRTRWTQSTGALVSDWANHAWLFSVFVLGYLCMAEDRILGVLDRGWAQALRWVALPGSVALLAWASRGDVYARFPGDWTQPFYALFWLAISLLSWSWLIVAVGWGRRSLRRESDLLRWLNPRVYPFYVFHQTVIVAVAYVGVTWPLGVHLRFGIISALSLLATLAAVELSRSVPGLRVLMGARR